MSNPKTLRPWKKGQSGNPRGALAHDPVKRALKRLTSQEVAELGSMLLAGDLDALQRVAKDPASTVLKVMIASVAVKTIQKGDAGSLDLLLNRLIGKVPNPVQLSTPPGEAIVINPKTEEEKKLDRQERLARIQDLALRLKAVEEG